MGFFKKLFGAAVVTGAAVGGTLYVKKRKEERNYNSDFEDFDDEKIFDITKGSDKDGNAKVTIVFNSKKAKNVADKAADKVIDVTDKAKDIVTDKLGEDTVATMKDKMEVAKDMMDEAASFAKDKANIAKDIVVDKVGEENIQTAKDKIKDVAYTAKEKISETVDKYIKPEDKNDFFEEVVVDGDVVEDVFEEDDDTDEINTDNTDDAKATETEDDVNIDDMLEDELDEL